MQPPAKFTAQWIRKACGGQLAGGRLADGRPDAGAPAVSTDSRTLRPGEAFVALVGPHHDAHDFVPQALEAGASIVVAERADESRPLPPHAALILVDDTARALTELATCHRRRLKGKLIAVTGSCGKSTVKSMIAVVLGRSARCTAARRSFNNAIGVSLTLLEAEVEDDFVVLEMGANHFGEIEALARSARPHAGVVTCIGECHLEAFGSREGVREAKAELIPHLDPAGLAVLNADDPLCLSLGDRFSGEVRTFGFSRHADVRAVDVRPDGEGTAFRACGVEFRLPAAGHHNVLNAAAAVCVCAWAGVGPQEASEGLAGLRLPSLRFEKRRIGGVTFVLDCYNSNPTAMRAALQAYLDAPAPRRRLVVCGDMLELGEASAQMHRRLGRLLALTRVDALVAVGPMGALVIEGWTQIRASARDALHFACAENAWRPLWEMLRPGDTVLVKGSRAMRMETIATAIADHVEATGREAAA